MMNEADLNLCLGVLRGYYPGEWDDGRNIVWTDALDGLDRDEALTAIKRFGRTEDYPKVSRFLAVVAAERSDRLCAERGRFMVGTGWVREVGATPAEDLSRDVVANRVNALRDALNRIGSPEVDA